MRTRDKKLWICSSASPIKSGIDIEYLYYCHLSCLYANKIPISFGLHAITRFNGPKSLKQMVTAPLQNARQRVWGWNILGKDEKPLKKLTTSIAYHETYHNIYA